MRILRNVNSSATRGTVFALVTLTDDVGKGLGPEVVAIIVSAMGRRWALSAAISCWYLGRCLLYGGGWSFWRKREVWKKLMSEIMSELTKFHERCI